MRQLRCGLSARALVAVGLLLAGLVTTTGSPADAASSKTSAYWLVGADGSVFPFGGLPFLGSATGTPLPAPVIGMAATRSGRGYWLATADGTIYAFGDAPHRGSVATLAPQDRPRSPVVGIAGTPDSAGYWLVTAAGGVYSFGDAGYFGNPVGAHPSPIVGIAPTPDGGGYWLASSTGGVYALGNARFLGPYAVIPLNKPIVGIAATRSGRGYLLAATDGGVFTYGDARFHGSTGGLRLNRPIVGLGASRGDGYFLVASDGGLFTFGDAHFSGSTGGRSLAAPIVGMTVAPQLVPYVPGTVGSDVSFPQCGGGVPSSASFGIVGVNDGRAFTKDPCLASLAAWAGPGQSAYMNLNAPPTGSTQGLTGPVGVCVGNDSGCIAYNYGYNAAIDAFSYATSQGVRASLWWLDVETANSWDVNTNNNDFTIQGALDALTSQGVLAGLYSTSYQWKIIAGGFAPQVPEWVATGADFQTAQQYCSPDHSFGARTTPLLTQFGTQGNPFDQDYACPQG